MNTPKLSAAATTQELVRLIAGFVFLQSCLSGMRLASPLLALREGHSEVAVGVLMALYALAPVFLSLPTGRFADRYGLKRPVALCVCAAASGAGLAMVFPVFPVLCLSALLTGGATASAMIALQRHVGRVASGPAEMRQAFSWLAIGPSISNLIGSLLTGFLIDQAGFRAAFAVLALMPLVGWGWVRTAREMPNQDAADKRKRGTAWDLWRNPVFTRLILANWVLASAWEVHAFVVPVLGNERGFSASVIGLILGTFAAATAVIRVVLPFLATRVREWALIAVSTGTAGLIYAAYPFMRTALGMGFCSMLLGLALGMVQPMLMAMLHQVTPDHRLGEAVGMRMMVINASSVAMPMLFGTAGALIGVTGLFWATAVALGCGLRLAYGLREGTSRTEA